MFSKAYELAVQFTHPLVVATRFFDKEVETTLGALVIVNEDGWIVTAAHHLLHAVTFQKHKDELEEYKARIWAINNNPSIKEPQKKVLIRGVKHNPKWVMEFAIVIAGHSLPLESSIVYFDHDVAFLKVDPQAIKDQKVFPTFVHPESMRLATSLCKFGYPFIQIKAGYDDNVNQFILPENFLPMPFFPMEGIYTRNIVAKKGNEGELDILFLETSSPGLRGQSGGPIVDPEGRIYGIQSHNITIPLGFKGQHDAHRKKEGDDQYINTGIGVHPVTLFELMRKNNISFAVS